MIPEVSIVVTAYKRPQYIGALMDSMFNQTLSNWECVIIDDGSDMPELTEICQRYVRQDKRVKYIQQENSGVSVARNRGIAESSAEFIAFHDDDDVSHPQRLEKQVTFLRQNPQVAAVNCYSITINHAGEVIERPLSDQLSPEPLIQQSNPANQYIMYKGGIDGIGAISCCRRECLVAVGGCNVDFKMVGDFDLTLRIMEKYSVALLREELYFYRQYGDVTNRLSGNPRSWEYSASAYIAAYFRRNNLSDMPAIASRELLAYVKFLPKDAIAAIFRRARGGHKRLLRRKRFAEMEEMLGYFNEVFSFDKKASQKMHRSLILWALFYGKLGALPAIIKSMKT